MEINDLDSRQPFEFLIFRGGGTAGVASWFPQFLESAYKKKKYEQIFILSSQSARPFHISALLLPGNVMW